ncbi:aspartyl protease APCB1 [Phoenix dactylifera]|uniref:Aspartyl protease APCB1 n=1 Tax=Phoenix dactylifera TaxID=42345 RepID=A0A8B7D528_PHODC|nr:aspartyl protease APCB1 [Phoenix dactylifera]
MERERDAASRPGPQLQGVVIISLPPPDDPSKGKTITAFTLSDSPLPQSDPHPHPQPRGSLPTRSPTPIPRRSLLSPKKALATFLGASLLAFSLWACLFAEEPLQLLGENEEDGRRRNESRSFLFPLYSKSRGRVLREVMKVKFASLWTPDGVEVRRAKQSNKLEASSSARFPVRGNVFPDGQYYTSILVGNPPRPYFLDVDTGSDLTWIQCDAPCSSCAKGPHPLYKPTKGKIVPPGDSMCLEMQSNQNLGYCESCPQCDYEIEYADHSSSMGVLARDQMYLTVANGGRTKLDFVFGCAYDQQGQLLASPAKTDGILGLGRGKISLPSQLANQGILSNVVGHCFTSEADGGGYMFLGDDFVPRWGMTWVPILGDLTNYYRARVLKISYGGQQLKVGRKGGNVIQVVFDSGSSYTYFPNEAYASLVASLKYVSRGLVRDDSDPTLPICWRANFPVRSLKDVKQFFEPVTLQFEKKWGIMSRTLTIPPEGYLIINNQGNVCFGILNGTEVHDGMTIILGGISLRGKLVVYDNMQQKVGWVQSDCIKPQRPRGFPFFI